MTNEIRDLRAKWQTQKQQLLKADFNHVEEQLARLLHFANKQPLISELLEMLRQSNEYVAFDPEEWLSKREPYQGNELEFSLDDEELAAQCMKILEMVVNHRQTHPIQIASIGETILVASHATYNDYTHSALESIFEPFYLFIDTELRTFESLITPLDILKEVQSLVDITTSTQYPNTHKLLTDTYKQLFSLSASSSGASWFQVGYECRHILIEFANEIFQPEFVSENNPQPKGDDAREKLKWIIRYHLKKVDSGENYVEAIEKIVKTNWEFVCNLGHHKDSATGFDAKLAVIYTYLTISTVTDVMQRSS